MFIGKYYLANVTACVYGMRLKTFTSKHIKGYTAKVYENVNTDVWEPIGSIFIPGKIIEENILKAIDDMLYGENL